MPTSVCCRASDALTPRAPRGYTLIEMVVVLAIVSLLAGLAAPQLYRAYQSVTRQTDQDAIVAQLASLSPRANALGVSFVLDAADIRRMLPDGRPVVALPSGWQLRTDKPIRFNLIGVCDGGAVRLTAPDNETRVYTLEPPACEVRDSAPTARL